MTFSDPRFRLAFWILLAALAARTVAMGFLPLTDATEGRYALVAKGMAETGDWVTPRVWMFDKNIPFLGKPPLFFWAAAASMRLFGINEFASRLPSTVAAIALLGLLYGVMERYGGKRSGMLSVLVTASCGFFLAMTGIVAVDMVFSACVAGSLLAYFAFPCEPEKGLRRRWSLLVFLLLAAGFLTKGPVALVLFGLPVLLWTARWSTWRLLRDHRWLTGAALFIALTTPWFVACELRNPGFLTYFFVNENFLRFITPDYGDAYGNGHVYPRGAAILMFLAATAPWSLLGLWRLLRAKPWAATLGLRDKNAEFLLLSFLTGTLFWCLARQLLFTYLLPMVPLFAAWLVFTMKSEEARTRTLKVSTALLAAMVVVSAACIPGLRHVSTTREIVAVARQTSAGEALVFERKTPYSALFYAPGWVATHPKEALALTLARFQPGARSVLLVVNVSRKKELKALPPGSWTELATSGEWILGRVIFPAKVPQKPLS